MARMIPAARSLRVGHEIEDFAGVVAHEQAIDREIAALDVFLAFGNRRPDRGAAADVGAKVATDFE